MKCIVVFFAIVLLAYNCNSQANNFRPVVSNNGSIAAGSLQGNTFGSGSFTVVQPEPEKCGYFQKILKNRGWDMDCVL
ncbi:hypothetical protein B5X24_HaOG209436 [Helicoverpa armigera]|uniref:Uncharacterized protein n=1 Tax=Helicoverpa armigera TaxID=29058 RepID=A0A2W1BFI6_HELAM|nr:hypothetical protein B5X24_HaOG209436 [Helicoverpa armigera]